MLLREPGERPDGVSLLVRHLWGPLLNTGHYRVRVGGEADIEWEVLQRLWVSPTSRKARLLVSEAPRRPVARALTAFGGIRTSQQRVGRGLLATALRTGLPVTREHLVLERHTGARAQLPEPLQQMESVLGFPLLTIIGIRTGANAKATLQLFTRDGCPAGYAKIAWNSLTSQFVRDETRALMALRGIAGRLKVPELLGQGTVGDYPFLITRPLPSTVRMLTPRENLTIEQFAAASPAVRFCHVSETQQFRALQARLVGLNHPLSAQHVPAAQALGRALSGSSLILPVASRWHGDLVRWNAARDPDGNIWVWDWEMSEEDAVVGLDLLHWLVNTHGGESALHLPRTLLRTVDANAQRMRALGLGRDQATLAAGLYALTIAERHLRFAAQHDGWQRNRLGPAVITELIAVGQLLVRRAEMAST